MKILTMLLLMTLSTRASMNCYPAYEDKIKALKISIAKSQDILRGSSITGASTNIALYTAGLGNPAGLIGTGIGIATSYSILRAKKIRLKNLIIVARAYEYTTGDTTNEFAFHKLHQKVANEIDIELFENSLMKQMEEGHLCTYDLSLDKYKVHSYRSFKRRIKRAIKEDSQNSNAR